MRKASYLLLNICWNNNRWMGLCHHPEKKTACETWGNPRKYKWEVCVKKGKPFCGEAYVFKKYYSEGPWGGFPSGSLERNRSVIIFVSHDFSGLYAVGFYVLDRIGPTDGGFKISGIKNLSTHFYNSNMIPFLYKRYDTNHDKIGQRSYQEITERDVKSLLIDALNEHEEIMKSLAENKNKKEVRTIIQKIKKILKRFRNVRENSVKNWKLGNRKEKLKEFKPDDKKYTKYKKGLSKSIIDLEKRAKINKMHKYIVKLLGEKICLIAAGAEVGKNSLDLTAVINKKRYIFEVKTNNEGNFRSQMRHGISQLFEYEYMHFPNEHTRKCLVFQTKPTVNRINWLDYLENVLDILVIWKTKDDKFTASSKNTFNELYKLIH